MGLLNWLFGRHEWGYDFGAIGHALGPWRPYQGNRTLPHSQLPTTLTLPKAVKRWGDRPGVHPLNDVLFPYWLRLEPRLVGYLCRQLAAGQLYQRIEQPRAGKPPRILHAPAPVLKFMQRRILERLLGQLHVHPAAHGFVAGRSIFTNAAPHVGQRLVVCLDLRDFFPTITFTRIVGLFKSHGLSAKNALRLATLCTHEHRLPQGAPTSPAISNLICYKLDKRLDALMSKHGFAYTRYADDLTFSGGRKLVGLMRLIQRIVADEGFAIAPEKTRLQRSGQRQLVTGLTVNHQVAVPKRQRRLLRAMAHQQRLASEPNEDMLDFLAGHAAFMQPAHPDEARLLRDTLTAIRTDNG